MVVPAAPGGRTLLERVAAALGPDGLAVFAVFALVLGTVGYAAGRLLAFGGE